MELDNTESNEANKWESELQVSLGRTFLGVKNIVILTPPKREGLQKGTNIKL